MTDNTNTAEFWVDLARRAVRDQNIKLTQTQSESLEEKVTEIFAPVYNSVG